MNLFIFPLIASNNTSIEEELNFEGRILILPFFVLTQ